MISINNIDDYMNELVNRYNFSVFNEKNTITLNPPKDIGKGYMKIIEVSDDITIGVIDLMLQHPIVIYYEDYSNSLEITYCFEGTIPFTETGIVEANLQKNELGIYATPKSRGMTVYPSGQRIFSVSVEAKNLLTDKLPYLERYKNKNECDIQNLLYTLMKPKRVNARIYNYFCKIIQNDIDHELQYTYLDSLGKLLLMDLWQENVIERVKGRLQKLMFSDFEKKALKEAKDILMGNYASPPTISELSKMIALNEYKLKIGFRNLYGKSIHNFVRSIRMENAKYLLENRDLSIGQIANLSGYINASHFARAFREEYGLNPNNFRCGA